MIDLDSDKEDSDSSIVEIGEPPKPIPPLICLDEEEELVINTTITTSTITHVKRREVNFAIDVMADSSCPSPSHWTPDMKKFYNDDWGHEEDFIVENLQYRMSKSRDLWVVSDKDYFSKSRKSFQCRRCFEIGHRESCCPNPLPIKCFMCGQDNHITKNCPKRSCLTCGKRTKKFIPACSSCLKMRQTECPRCCVLGHNLIDCTDHWRRFHLTTALGQIKTPVECINKPWESIWCCNCGSQGHEAFTCNTFGRPFSYPFPFVFSYENSFNNTRHQKHSSNNAHQMATPTKHWKRYYEAPDNPVTSSNHDDLAPGPSFATPNGSRRGTTGILNTPLSRKKLRKRKLDSHTSNVFFDPATPSPSPVATKRLNIRESFRLRRPRPRREKSPEGSLLRPAYLNQDATPENGKRTINRWKELSKQKMLSRIRLKEEKRAKRNKRQSHFRPSHSHIEDL